jgi:hypothetical protein
MRDHTDRQEPSTALAQLPLLTPPRSAWPALDAALRRRRRPRAPWIAFAAAASFALATWLPGALAPPPAMPVAVPSRVATSPVSHDAERIRVLMAESAQLEAWIGWSRDEEVESAAAASLGLALQDRIERVDLLLARPDADPEALLPLWQERVLRLRQLAGLQSSEHLLAANGDAEAGQPVHAF